jgi:16S rRNA (adenine1518-N6/adenine1519-N6)-dimethyltransferase
MKKSRKVRLGQHLLSDKKIIEFIIKAANLTKADVVLEVGAGYGNLTIPLANASGKVIAVEKDPAFFNLLKERMNHFNNVEMFNNDIFEADIPRFNKIVSSLPYYISSKFLKWLLKRDFELGLLILQKEFVSKLTSEPGSKQYRNLTVLVRHEMDINVLKYISPMVFTPHPKVTSCIVKLSRLRHFFNTDLQFFFENMVNSLFSTKRKFNPNILDDLFIINKRVNELSIKELEKLALILYKTKDQNIKCS